MVLSSLQAQIRLAMSQPDFFFQLSTKPCLTRHSILIFDRSQQDRKLTSISQRSIKRQHLSRGQGWKAAFVTIFAQRGLNTVWLAASIGSKCLLKVCTRWTRERGLFTSSRVYTAVRVLVLDISPSWTMINGLSGYSSFFIHERKLFPFLPLPALRHQSNVKLCSEKSILTLLSPWSSFKSLPNCSSKCS